MDRLVLIFIVGVIFAAGAVVGLVAGNKDIREKLNEGSRRLLSKA